MDLHSLSIIFVSLVALMFVSVINLFVGMVPYIIFWFIGNEILTIKEIWGSKNGSKKDD